MIITRTEFEQKAREHFARYWDLRNSGRILDAARANLEYSLFVAGYWESFLDDNVHRPHIEVYEDEVKAAWDRVAGARDELYDLEHESSWFGIPVEDGILG